jgi:hypothetical protein
MFTVPRNKIGSSIYLSDVCKTESIALLLAHKIQEHTKKFYKQAITDLLQFNLKSTIDNLLNEWHCKGYIDRRIQCFVAVDKCAIDVSFNEVS